MSLTVFDCKGISATRRERIEEAAGKHFAQPYEGWIAADPFGVACGFSSRGRRASKGPSRSRATKRPSPSYAPPRAGRMAAGQRKRWAAGKWPRRRRSGGGRRCGRPKRREIGLEARCSDQRGQGFKVGGCAAEGGWPEERGAKANGPRGGH